MKKRNGFVSNSSSSSFIIGKVFNSNDQSPNKSINISLKLHDIGKFISSTKEYCRFLDNDITNWEFNGILFEELFELPLHEYNKYVREYSDISTYKDIYDKLKSGEIKSLYIYTFTGGVDGHIAYDDIIIDTIVNEIKKQFGYEFLGTLNGSYYSYRT